MKPKKTKKKQPQDLTLRNLRAMKKRIEQIEQWWRWLSINIHDLSERVRKLERKNINKKQGKKK